jgi:hypothetical protein
MTPREWVVSEGPAFMCGARLAEQGDAPVRLHERTLLFNL